MRGSEVYFLELGETWWEENRRQFEGKDSKMPERRPESLRNLDPEDLEVRERSDCEKSSKLSMALTLRQAKRSGSTRDQIEDEYLAERRQARAAERALADRDRTSPGSAFVSPPPEAAVRRPFPMDLPTFPSPGPGSPETVLSLSSPSLQRCSPFIAGSQRLRPDRAP